MTPQENQRKWYGNCFKGHRKVINELLALNVVISDVNESMRKELEMMYEIHDDNTATIERMRLEIKELSKCRC